MKQRWLILAWLLPLILAAAPEAKKRPPTGLKILSTTLEAPTSLSPGGRPVALTVQNVTDKTIVAVAGLFEEFRADGTHTYPENDAAHGVGMDFDGPNPADPGHHNWIRPGQVTTIRLFAVGNPETASVKATITGLIYEDRTSEGSDAQMIFQQRREQGEKAREAAGRETSPRKKAELEGVAKWFETHDAVEAK